MADSYFIKRGEKVSGPFSAGQVKKLGKDGKFRDDDGVSNRRDGPWTPAAKAFKKQQEASHQQSMTPEAETPTTEPSGTAEVLRHEQLELEGTVPEFWIRFPDDRRTEGPLSGEQLKKLAARGYIGPATEIGKTLSGPWKTAGNIPQFDFTAPPESNRPTPASRIAIKGNTPIPKTPKISPQSDIPAVGVAARWVPDNASPLGADSPQPTVPQQVVPQQQVPQQQFPQQQFPQQQFPQQQVPQQQVPQLVEQSTWDQTVGAATSVTKEQSNRNLVSCRHCNAMLARNCTACPHCGGTFETKADRKRQQQEQNLQAFVGILLGLIALAYYWLEFGDGQRHLTNWIHGRG